MKAFSSEMFNLYLGYNFKRLGYDYNGSMRVLATILNGIICIIELGLREDIWRSISFEKLDI